MQILQMFAATYCYVLLRAFQQRNVAFDNYGWIVPTSYMMAVFDIFIVGLIAHAGWTWPIVLANGTGGCSGALTAMWFHKKHVKK